MSVLEHNVLLAPRWRFKKANWEAYEYLSEVEITALDLNVIEDVEEYNEKM